MAVVVVNAIPRRCALCGKITIHSIGKRATNEHLFVIFVVKAHPVGFRSPQPNLRTTDHSPARSPLAVLEVWETKQKI